MELEARSNLQPKLQEPGAGSGSHHCDRKYLGRLESVAGHRYEWLRS